MGGQLSAAMEENGRVMFERQSAAQKRMMERQMEVQRRMVGKQMAMNIARQRDMFMFYSTFAGLAALGLVVGAIKKKNPTLLGPLVPIGVAWAYQWDMAYNNKLDRIRANAAKILEEHPELVALPGAWPTVDDIDRAIEDAKQ